MKTETEIPTPRTTALCEKITNDTSTGAPQDVVTVLEHAAILERENIRLRTALGDLVDAVNVEFPGGMSDIGGKTGVALIRAVDALAEKLDVAAVIEAQKHNHE